MNTTYKLGSLFTGYGGLDIATAAALADFGIKTDVAWVCDNAPHAKKIIAKHYPQIHNLEDITRVNWENVEKVDVITGGSPCQDLSEAGNRAGMKPGTRSGLWESMLTAIETINPKLVIWENVKGARTAPAVSSRSNVEQCPRCMGNSDNRPLRALGRVLGELSAAGYSCAWETITADKIGAPQYRTRIFLIAWNNIGELHELRELQPLPNQLKGAKRVATIKAKDKLRWSPSDFKRRTPGASFQVVHELDKLQDVITRWEKVTGRHAPTPVKDDQRLNLRFVEWCMGLQDGHVTAVNELSDTAQMLALGNGVIPQQAHYAIHQLIKANLTETTK